jgi:transposase
MVTKSTRPYKRVGENMRVRIVALREQHFTLAAIAKKTKVKIKTVHSIPNKWNRLDTIQDLLKRGRPRKVDDHTGERLARILQKGEVESASQLAMVAAADDNANISSRTANRVLHQQGLDAMHADSNPRTREKKARVCLCTSRLDSGTMEASYFF